MKWCIFASFIETKAVNSCDRTSEKNTPYHYTLLQNEVQRHFSCRQPVMLITDCGVTGLWCDSLGGLCDVAAAVLMTCLNYSSVDVNAAATLHFQIRRMQMLA